MSNRDKLNSSGSYIQYLVTAYERKGLEKNAHAHKRIVVADT